MNHTDAHVDVGAYVLHALPADEEAAFENHLAGCPECRREADQLSTAANRLVVAEVRAPSADVRRRVLDQIATVRQDRAVAVLSRRHRRRRRLLRLALAASLAAAVALGGVAWWQHSEADAAREQATDARAETRALTGVLTAPDATVSTEELPGGATASVIASRSEGTAALVAVDLPPLSGGRVYELWYAEAGQYRPAGLLHAVNGRQTQVLDGPMEGATAVCITVEPVGGSARPTTDPLAYISLPE
ncbi:anti-sigma factor domain-containing protein [Streptomyces sp. NPDC052013]|uniref:anti-sigma factor n=1 Tax=Streptomyces sp. NPDC052013 TaxID=3365679 RepID=UPI0037D52609